MAVMDKEMLAIIEDVKKIVAERDRYEAALKEMIKFDKAPNEEPYYKNSMGIVWENCYIKIIEMVEEALSVGT